MPDRLPNLKHIQNTVSRGTEGQRKRPRKERFVSIRFTDQQREYLEGLSATRDQSLSDVVRQIVRDRMSQEQECGN